MAVATSADAQSRGAAGSASAPAPERIDYLTFAQGAVPIRIDGAGARLGANYERAIRIIDGNPQGFTLTARPFEQDAGDTVFVYELPALTIFDRFAVPNVLETPAPNQTFTKQIEILGSAQSATNGFTLLASQEAARPVNHFNGGWRTMGLRPQLKQAGAASAGYATT